MRDIFVGNAKLAQRKQQVVGEYVDLLGEPYFKIANYDALPPFFMSLISSSDHWLFISSTGGLTAGRVNADSALFPYYTVDKITENAENTGSKTIMLVSDGEKTHLWEPFSDRYSGAYEYERTIYKNIPGTSVVFEEINKSIGLRFRYAWRTSDEFGFVRTAWLSALDNPNLGVEILDGIQNIIPANVTGQTQNEFSNLIDAYKRNELEPVSGLGIYSMSSTLTDMAEPSESLLATSVAQVGLGGTLYLLSSEQLDRFRAGEKIKPEMDVRGKRGAYFAHGYLDFELRGEACWHIFADVNQDQASLRKLIGHLKANSGSMSKCIENSIAENRQQINRLVASSDGLQFSEDQSTSAHHYANVVFNIMRGGILPSQYSIQKSDFVNFIKGRNRKIYKQYEALIEDLPAEFSLDMIHEISKNTGSTSFLRLCYSYLPLSFSRRHGDPSRPWNKFNIQIKNPDGSRRLDYEGNWRDIFQNWEPIAYSFPAYVEHMISTFLNATTIDGYNPYRITRAGLDWEKPDPHNPWANIGYWSDHQIIYLLKLLEVSESFRAGKLSGMLNQRVLSYANVPYRIKPFEEILQDPYNTIQFDWELDQKIEHQVEQIGADGRLILQDDQQVYQVGMGEKLMTLLLAKLVNFVPDGGIWMNTQRPEWNDANNALVGKGLSVVTLAYLRRYVGFLKKLMAGSSDNLLEMSVEVIDEFNAIRAVLSQFEPALDKGFSSQHRLQLMEALGIAGSKYRWKIYKDGLSFEQSTVDVAQISIFLDLVLKYIDDSLAANVRDDGLFHSYNILKTEPAAVEIKNLYEMLEGQVAVLSSGYLSAEHALRLLRSLRSSDLYRADQHSYILYPDRDLSGFLVKNTIRAELVEPSKLVKKLVELGSNDLLVRNEEGDYHFNGSFRNIRDVDRVLSRLKGEDRFKNLVLEEQDYIRRLFEGSFNHDEFTGRSGTFFAYEGLGSIYWHMVSKLLLAVQEIAWQYRDDELGPELLSCYRDIRSGLGFNKTPDVYGAFPSDPYSHTPKGQGAKQPGMTGAVKEEILARLAEAGLFIEDGEMTFYSHFLDDEELASEEAVFKYYDVHGFEQTIDIHPGTLAYTFCQVPVVISLGEEDKLVVYKGNEDPATISGNRLGPDLSQSVFAREGYIKRIDIQLSK